MVTPAIRAYMELEKPRVRLTRALARVDAAYTLHQAAFERLGPYPGHGWDKRALVAREDAICAAIEDLKVVVGDVGTALALLPLKPPF